MVNTKLPKKRLLLFDVDGTLTDTLPAHAQFCLDLNKEFKFELPLPTNPHDIEAWKRIAKTPMNNFFRSAGFPEEEIEMLMHLYSTRFASDPKYESKPFEGIPEMIRKLKDTGNNLAIISSNIAPNIRRDLGEESFSMFDLVIDLPLINKHCNGKKSQAIDRVIYVFDDTAPIRTVYVGDTLKDYEATELTGCCFVGTTYGWDMQANDPRIFNKQGLDLNNRQVITVDTVKDLESFLIKF